MAKHWNPSDHAPRRQPRRWTVSEIRLTLLGGVLLGLVIASTPSGVRPGDDATGGASDGIHSLRVIDGDTFIHDGEKIRIADIDTPEVDGRCAAEVQLAARATSRLRQLLQSGPFELHPIAGRDEDRYGRKLRIVTRNGHSLGDQLVAHGLARTWTGRRQPWC